MAVVKAPALSMDASGNLGSICYSKWKGLHVARGAWNGTYQTSDLREEVQDRVATVARAWSGTLNSSDRQRWNDLAKTQVRVSRGMSTYIPCGYQVFLEVNILRLRLGVPISKSPFEGRPEAMLGEVELAYDMPLGEVKINLTEVYDPGSGDYYIDVFRAGPFENAGRHAISGEYRFLKKWDSLSSGFDNTVIALRYYWYKVRWLWEKGATGNFFERQVYTV